MLPNGCHKWHQNKGLKKNKWGEKKKQGTEDLSFTLCFFFYCCPCCFINPKVVHLKVSKKRQEKSNKQKKKKKDKWTKTIVSAICLRHTDMKKNENNGKKPFFPTFLLKEKQKVTEYCYWWIHHIIIR